MKNKNKRPEQAARLRRRAEEAGRAKEARLPKNPEALTPEETRRTLHELRVHQIELEMQNDELRRAQAELDAARARYFDLYDLAPVGYCTVSEKGLILEANLTAARLLGAERSALAKRPVSQFILEEDQDIYYLHRRRLFETGAPQSCELRLLKKDGTVFWACLEAVVVKDADGAPVYRAVMSDLTGRKNKETELLKLGHVLKVHSESSQAMLHAENEQAYLDKVCSIIAQDCARAFVFIGFAEDDPNKSVRLAAQAGFVDGFLERSRLTWADAKRGLCPTGAAIRTGKPGNCRNIKAEAASPWRAAALERGYNCALALPLTAGGQAFGALTIYSKTPDDFSEEDVKLLTGLAEDLSYGLRALRLRAAYKLSGEDVQRMAHIGVWTHDLAAGLLTWSDEIYRIFGLDPEKFPASYKTFLNTVHPVDRELVKKAYADSVRSGVLYNISYRLLLKDGGVKYINERCETFYDSGGRPLRSVGTIHDITDRHRAEEELHSAQAELGRAKRLSDIGTLAAIVAHELRNPLATIGMAIVNIKRKSKNPELETHFANIDKKIFESNQLINNLLFYSRLRPPHYERFDIRQLVREAIDAAKHYRAGTSIGVDIDSLEGVIVEADPLQIKEVLNNIINNAGDAGRAEDGKLKVSGARENGFVHIAVQDSGPGIDRETLARVFDPFYTTKPNGTGLGLPVCRQIMTFHGGSVELKSEPGKGTTADILLPVKKAAPAKK